MRRPLRLSVRNATRKSRVVAFEPAGRQFLLAVDEKLVITLRAGTEAPDLRVVESGSRTLVFLAGCTDVRVIKGGVAHDLEPAVESTTSEVATPRRSRDALWDRDREG